MRRAFLLGFLVATPFAVVSPSLAGCGQCNGALTATPATGVAPLSIHVKGELAEWAPTMEFHMANEAIVLQNFSYVDAAGSCAYLPYAFDYTFSCPGTYRIDMVDPLYPGVARSTSVTVTEPPKFWLFVFDGYTDHDVYLGTHYSSAERPFSVSTVDWGDGTSETFVWSPRGLYKGTPNHLYKADGEYVASVTHHYFGNYCTWDQTVTTVVKVPTVTTAVEQATWGSVKSMYRK